MQTSPDNYKKELGEIKAGEEFKKDTLALLLKAADAGDIGSDPKAGDAADGKPRLIAFRKQLLAVASLALVAGVSIWAVSGNGGFGSELPVAEEAPAMVEEYAMDSAPEETETQPETSSQPTRPSQFFTQPPARNFEGAASVEVKSEALPSMGQEPAAEEPTAGSGETVAGQEAAMQDKDNDNASREEPPATGEEEPATGEQEQAARPVVSVDSFGGDRGQESIILEDFEEYTGLLPGEEDIPDELPVFRNSAFYVVEEDAEPAGMSEQDLATVVEDVALALGFGEAEGYETTSDLSGTLVQASFALGRIDAYSNGRVMVELDPAYSEALPAQPGEGSEAAEQESWGLEVVQALEDLFAGMKNPYAEILFDRNIYGEGAWRVEIHDEGDGLADFLQNRSLAGATLHGEEESGRLYVIWLENRHLTAYPLAQYPTITLEEALQKLDAGEALTSVGDEAASSERVVGTDLVYYCAGNQEYFLPYYRFFVELPYDADNDQSKGEPLTRYGVWYVPAIQDEYVEIAAELMGG